MSELDENDLKRNIEKDIVERDMVNSPLFSCFDLNCKNHFHIGHVESLFVDLKKTLLDSTSEFRFVKKNNFRIIPGWNDEVKEVHAISREKFLLWKNQGKPLQGIFLDDMKSSRTVFKSALQRCKDNEKVI